MLTRSRTRLTALAITSPRRTAAASSVSTVTAADSAGVARYLRKVYAPSSAPVVTASASPAVRAGSATATDLTPSSRTVPVFAATDRSAVPAARRRFSASKAASPSGALPSPTATISVAGSLPPPGILVSSSSSPVAPRAVSVSARVPPSASSTPSAPGATLGPSGVCATPMTRTSASAVPAADSLFERETVTLPMLLHRAAPACYPEPRRDPPHTKFPPRRRISATTPSIRSDYPLILIRHGGCEAGAGRSSRDDTRPTGLVSRRPVGVRGPASCCSGSPAAAFGTR